MWKATEVFWKCLTYSPFFFYWNGQTSASRLLHKHPGNSFFRPDLHKKIHVLKKNPGVPPCSYVIKGLSRPAPKRESCVINTSGARHTLPPITSSEVCIVPTFTKNKLKYVQHTQQKSKIRCKKWWKTILLAPPLEPINRVQFGQKLIVSSSSLFSTNPAASSGLYKGMLIFCFLWDTADSTGCGISSLPCIFLQKSASTVFWP